MFNVAIVGGEGFEDYKTFNSMCVKILSKKAKTDSITIFSTGDEVVEKFARHYGINVKLFYCDWKKDGKNALKSRNERLLKDCNAIIMFDDGLKDTRMIYSSAQAKNIPSRRIS